MRFFGPRFNLTFVTALAGILLQGNSDFCVASLSVWIYFIFFLLFPSFLALAGAPRLFSSGIRSSFLLLHCVFSLKSY